MSCNVCVVGSIRMDFVVHAPRFARAGETILGESFENHPGGKGANQAVAASRMGANVSLVGCIGEDDWGSQLRGVLTADGVDIHNVRTCERFHTGAAIITVIPGGEHMVVVAPGANGEVQVDDVDAAQKTIAGADVLVLQCEIAEAANLRAIEIARKGDTTVLLNGAPAGGATPELLSKVDLLVVKRDEARSIVGDAEGEISAAGLARRLASLGPERVVITLGAEGAIHFNGRDLKTFEAIPTESVDITAAGDAFVGALAVLRSEGARLPGAVRHASAAAALASSTCGAIPSLPTREKVEELLSQASTKN